MIRRFFAWLRRKAAPTRLTFQTQPLCRIQTDLTDIVRLHAGDIVVTERNFSKFAVVAYVLRDFQLQRWPLFCCDHLREAETLKTSIDEALSSGAIRCNPRARLDRERAKAIRAEEVAF